MLLGEDPAAAMLLGEDPAAAMLLGEDPAAVERVQAAMHAIVGVHKSDEMMAVELQPPYSELNEARCLFACITV